VQLHELGEFGLIARIAEAVGAGRGSVVIGIGDDAAVLETPSTGYMLVCWSPLMPAWKASISVVSG